MIDTRHKLVAGLAGGGNGLAGPGLLAGALRLISGVSPAGFAAAGSAELLVDPDDTPVGGRSQGRPGISNAHTADWLSTDFQPCQVAGT